MTVLGALQVLGFIVVLVSIASGLMCLAQRAGFLDDPRALPWEESPGARTDRRRLLEDEVR